MKVLIIGVGGLLGSAIARRLRIRGHTVHGVTQVPWADPAAAAAHIATEGQEFLRQADSPWAVVWCAGSATTVSDERAFEGERHTLALALDALERDAAASHLPGALVFVSSAGGIYAGASDPPFTELTPPAPLSGYGRHKLRSEQLVASAASRWKVPVAAARVSNVYGPGQDLAKPQGLITQLCLSALLGEPVRVYVPLDTTRDYLFVDDAAQRLARLTERIHGERNGSVHVKVIHSGVTRSIAALIGECQSLPGLRPLIVQRATPETPLQSRNLRVKSVHWLDLDDDPLTPLAAGIGATAEDVARQLRAGRPTPAVA